MPVKSVNARSLLSIYPEDVKDHLQGLGVSPEQNIVLELDDGPVETTGWRIIYSTFCWNFQRVFEKTPLVKDNLLTGRVTCDSHLDLMNEGYWRSYEDYGYSRPMLEYLDQIVAKSTSCLRNYIVEELQEYVVSLSMDDYVELVEFPAVKETLERVGLSRESVNRCHERMSKILLTDPGLAKNKLVQFVRSRFINMQQVLQCIGPKGSQTRTDSRFYNDPILNSFLTGLNTLIESTMESCSATKAIRYSRDYVEKGEYFQRKMQLGAMPILGLVPGDCGTQSTLTVKLTEDIIYAFEGKEIIEEVPSAARRFVWVSDKTLVGQTVKLRSVLHCKEFSNQHVCERCFGYMSHSIVTGSNLGLVSISELCRDASQSLLSTKHNDFTNVFMQIVLGELEAMYLMPDTENISDIRLQEIPGVKDLRLAVDSRYVYNLTDALVVDDVSRLTLTNTTSIYMAELWFTNEDGFEQVVPLQLAQGSRMASFSLDMLEHVRKKRWTVFGGDKYVFDLKDWDVDKPIFSLPMQNENMLEYIKRLEVFVRSSGKTKTRKAREEVRRLVDAEDVPEGLMVFNGLVSSMLSVNIAHQEIAIASMTARSNKDCRFPDTPAQGVLLPYETLIRERSMSGIYAYEHHEWTYGRMSTYLNRNRLYHPLDAIFRVYPDDYVMTT